MKFSANTHDKNMQMLVAKSPVIHAGLRSIGPNFRMGILLVGAILPRDMTKTIAGRNASVVTCSVEGDRLFLEINWRPVKKELLKYYTEKPNKSQKTSHIKKK